jgi:hypothetical protein
LIQSRSQVQSTLSRSIGDSGDASCVLATSSVEYDGFNAGLLGALRDKFANLACLGGFVTIERTKICFERGCRS